MAAWKNQRAVPPLEWMRAIRDGIDLSKSVKAVAFCLGLHANAKTAEAYPGWKHLAWESGCSRRTVIAALGELEHGGLLYCAERGSSYGVKNRASKYLLTLHDELGRITLSYEHWLKTNDLESPAAFIERTTADPGDPWAALSTGPGTRCSHCTWCSHCTCLARTRCKKRRDQVQKATRTRCSHCTPRG